MVKQNGGACDHGRHSAESAYEKVNGNFPRPDRRFDDGLPIITGLARNRTARNIDTAPSNNAIFPSLLAQFFKPLFRWRISGHEKNANAKSAAMIDTTAVAKAE